MPLPEFDRLGYLPPGIHAATLAEVIERYGVGSAARQRQANLLRLVVEAAKEYHSLKRVLIWGSFITDKQEPGDLDYSVVTALWHDDAFIAAQHHRFFIAREARVFYGVDRGFLLVPDYPLEKYIEMLDFLGHTREKQSCGIVEISVRGETLGDTP